MPATLIVGDIHLGKGLSMGRPGIGASLNSRILDQFRLCDWILDVAIDRHVTCMILTGDVFEDAKPDYILVDYFIQWLKRCAHVGIEVHIIAGNHDIRRSGSNYNSVLDIISSFEIEGIYVYKHINTIYHGLVGFTLVPFRDRKGFNAATMQDALERVKALIHYEAADIPATYDRVMVGHLAIEGSMFVGDEIDDINNELMCPVSMFEDYDYVWMGHVHKPQVLSQAPYVSHIGSLDLSDFGEVEQQKILVLFDAKLPNKFEEIPVPSRQLRKIKVNVPEFGNSTDAILAALAEADASKSLEQAILKIEAQIVGSDVPLTERNLIEQACYKTYNVHNISAFTESRQTIVVPQEKRQDMDNTIDVKSAIKRYADDIESFENDEEKRLFIEEALAVYDAYQESL